MVELGESIVCLCFAVVGLIASICYRWRSFWLNVAAAGFYGLICGLVLAIIGLLDSGHGPGVELLDWSSVFRTIGFAAVVVGFAGALADLGRRINSLEDSAYASGRRIPAEAMDGDALRPWGQRNEGSHDIQC